MGKSKPKKGKWKDPAAEKFSTVAEAVHLLSKPGTRDRSNGLGDLVHEMIQLEFKWRNVAYPQARREYEKRYEEIRETLNAYDEFLNIPPKDIA